MASLKDFHFTVNTEGFLLIPSGLPGNCFEIFLPRNVGYASIPLLKPDVFYPHLHKEPLILPRPLPHPGVPAGATRDHSEDVPVKGVYLGQLLAPVGL